MEAILSVNEDMPASHVKLRDEIGMYLVSAFPGYHWGIDLDATAGTVVIECGQVQDAIFTNMPYAYLMKLRDVVTDTMLKDRVVRAGGEILERARLNRGKYKWEDVKRVDGVLEEEQPNQKPNLILPAWEKD